MRRRLPRRLGRHESAELADHLGELRGRLIVSLAALAVGFGAAFAVNERLIGLLTRPLPDGRELVTLGVAEPFVTSLKVSLYAGLLVALPVFLWQAWGFLAPALSPAVERAIAGLAATSVVLGSAGLAFGYFIALPAAVGFLTTYNADLFDIQIRASDYLSFASLVLFAVTVVFQLPIAILGLVRVGVLSSAKLRRNRRLGYVLVTALAVALPGVDPVTTALEVIPLAVLFEATIWVSVFFERRWLGMREPGLGAGAA